MLKMIKLKCLDFALPIMKRKWDRIDENKKYYMDRKKELTKMFNNGLTYKEMIERVEYNKSTVYRIISEIKNH